MILTGFHGRNSSELIQLSSINKITGSSNKMKEILWYLQLQTVIITFTAVAADIIQSKNVLLNTMEANVVTALLEW